MSEDRRLIEDYLPIQAISADLPAATPSGSAVQAGIVATRFFEIPAEALMDTAEDQRDCS